MTPSSSAAIVIPSCAPLSMNDRRRWTATTAVNPLMVAHRSG